MKSMMTIGCVLALAVAANATVLMQDNFTYPDGALTAAGGGWTAHSGAGTVPVQVLNNAAVLVQGTGKEDVNKAIGSTLAAGGKFYAGFDVNITGGNGGTAGSYFAHFKDSGASNFAGRVFTASLTGSDYTFGLGENNTPTLWSTGMTYGTTYRIVVAYDFDTKTSTLWVSPASESSTSISVASTYAALPAAAFCLRQGSGAGTQTIDNLVVATTFAEALPEPATMILLGLGGLFIARKRH